MTDANGFHVDVARVESMEKDMTTMRVNVRDFDEAYAFLKARGFKNARGEDHAIESKYARSCLMISPSRLYDPTHPAHPKSRLTENDRQPRGDEGGLCVAAGLLMRIMTIGRNVSAWQRIRETEEAGHGICTCTLSLSFC